MWLSLPLAMILPRINTRDSQVSSMTQATTWAFRIPLWPTFIVHPGLGDCLAADCHHMHDRVCQRSYSMVRKGYARFQPRRYEHSVVMRRDMFHMGRRDTGKRRRSSALAGGSGETEYYSWVETDDDVEVRLRFPSGTSAKSIQLSLTRESITVALSGRENPVLQGQLKGEVRADLSAWTMEEEAANGGAKVMYLTLDKVLDAESQMTDDWMGVLEGEEATSINYPDKEQDFDVEEYVKKMGYDRERDAHKVDKTMFADVTGQFRNKMQSTIPRVSSVMGRNNSRPAVAEPKVSPVIDTGVIGAQSAYSSPPDATPLATDASAKHEVAMDTSADNGKVDEVETSVGQHDCLNLDQEAGRDASQSKSRDIKRGEAGKEGEGAKQRESARELEEKYQQLLEAGVLADATNADGTPWTPPHMDDLAAKYKMGDVFFSDDDFTEAELSRFASGTPAGDMPDFDMNDANVQAAFGLGGMLKGEVQDMDEANHDSEEGTDRSS